MADGDCRGRRRLLATLAGVVALYVNAQARDILVYVPNSNSNTVSVYLTLGGGALAPIATIPVGRSPMFSAVRGDQAFAYVTNRDDASVSVIDTATQTVVQTVVVDSCSTPPCGVFGVVVSPDGTTVYVATRTIVAPQGTVRVFSADLATGQLTPAGSVNTGSGPRGLAISRDGSRLYVANEADGSVSVIDTAANAAVATVTVGSQPTDVTVNDTRSRAYVSAAAESKVYVIDTSTAAVIATASTGLNPIGVSVTPDGKFYYAANQGDGTISQFSAATDTPIAPPVPSGPGVAEIAIAPEGDSLYPSNAAANTVAMYSITPGTGALVPGTSVVSGSLPYGLNACGNGNAMLIAGRTFVANTAGAIRCAGATPAFAGGTLKINGAGLWIPNTFAVGSAGATIDTNGFDTTLVGGFTGRGTLTLTGAGVLRAADRSSLFPATSLNPASGAIALVMNNATFAGGGPGEEIASLAGSGTVILDSGALIIGADNSSTVFSGTVTGKGEVRKVGTGALSLAGTMSLTDRLAVQGGTLYAAGSVAGLAISGSATFSPGAGASRPGLLNTSGLTVGDSSTLAIDLNGNTPGTGYDRIVATAIVALEFFSRLSLTMDPGFAPLPGQVFTIIDNQGSGPVQGRFRDLPQGALVPGGSRLFRISYTGGDGNDVTLTEGAVPCPTGGITPAIIPFAYREVAFTVTFGWPGGVSPITFSLTGSVPGLSFDRGTLSGKPTSRGFFPITVTAVDAVGCHASTTVNFVVAEKRRMLIGSGAGDSRLRMFNIDSSTPDVDMNAFSGSRAGASVALADTDGNGFADLVAGAGPGGGPVITIFEGATDTARVSFFAFDPAFRGGVEVAAGDLNGDGIAEVIAAPGCAGPSVIRAFDGRTGALVREYPTSTPAWSCGLHVAAADVNGDGVADIVLGSGGVGTPFVQILDGVTGAVIRTFYPYDVGFTGGVYVAAGDVTGDGFADVITGAGPGGGPHVRVFDGVTGQQIPGPLGSFYAYAPNFAGGVRVAAGDLFFDGHAEIITGAGPGGAPHVRVWNALTGTEIYGVFAFDPSFTGGVFVAGETPLGRMHVDLPVPGPTATSVRIAGWAFCESSVEGTGVDRIDAWAIPLTGIPIFVGEAPPLYTIDRPDVAAAFGGQFLTTGFDFTGTLAPGAYDLVVFARNSVTLKFDQARVVHITVQ